jgi:hypothetical protein
MSKELEWWATEDETFLATIIIDEDYDVFCILLARDLDRRYRCIEVLGPFESDSVARDPLFNKVSELVAADTKVVEQGDETGIRADIFEPTRPWERLSPSFNLVNLAPGYSSAKGIIAEAMHHYTDVDGNFIEQFQTTAFDSRLWELYLFAFLNEENLFIDRSNAAPDFLVSNGFQTVGIEAVTVQPSPPDFQDDIDPTELSPERIRELQKDFLPIKFGSPLYSKLTKKYWTLPHVRNRPLLFAIADFHAKQSVLWSSTALGEYLYGYRQEWQIDAEGELHITPVAIDGHHFRGKSIPSGYFFTEGAENVSGVLFSATGTISKFIRMGKVAGFGNAEVRILYQGTCYKHDPNTVAPEIFSFEVNEEYEETWAEGMSLFHNPRALHPVSPEMFPDIGHHFLAEDGKLVSYLPGFHPYNGLTVMIQPTGNDEGTPPA